jgi:hypothetical protein
LTPFTPNSLHQHIGALCQMIDEIGPYSQFHQYFKNSFSADFPVPKNDKAKLLVQ